MEILDICFTSVKFDLPQYYDDTKLSWNEATFATFRKRKENNQGEIDYRLIKPNVCAILRERYYFWKRGESMTDALLQQILDRLGNMGDTLHRLNDGQQRLETEIKDLRNGQQQLENEMKNLRDGQKQLEKDVKDLHNGQKRLENEVKNLRDGQKYVEKEQAYLKAGLKELNELMTALLHRQDETDAKLEALATDIHNIHGEITFLKQDLHKLEEKADSHYQKLNEQLDNIKLDVDFAVHKTTENERELYKMKSRLF
jgi:chromosome segregation ATPase